MRIARRFLEFGSVALLVIEACGGSVLDHGGGSGSGGHAGTSGTGGATSGVGGAAGAGGGVAGAAGTSSTGMGGTVVTGVGGNTGMGGTIVTGAGGSTGVGGSLPDLCQLPWDAGPCRGIVEAWWHDPSTGVCMPVNYSGCGGNANRFASRDECLSKCRGGSPDLDQCQLNSDCVLASPGCCGACEPVNDRSFLAVNAANTAKLHPRCTGVACGACPPLPIGVTSTSRYFIPTCQNGQCTVTDIRQTVLTDCQSTSDCYLRGGAHCCETCGSEIVALNRNASVVDFVCGGVVPPCPPCIPAIPPGYSASCNAGRCTVQEPPCTMEHPCPL